MHQAEKLNLEGIRRFVAASEEIRFESQSRGERYAWVEGVLVQFAGRAGDCQRTSRGPSQKEFLLDYLARNNENPRLFVWTKGPEKLQRIIEAAKDYQAAHPTNRETAAKGRNTIRN